MRQNLEEMQATQEQLEETNLVIKKKNNEMQAQMNAINKVALVSKTDTKGIITYVNDLFCEVAGYSREELIGKPHNIVRHPDMPKAAFKNLWDTIQAGEVWSGKVKNRKKDGGYYWVDANISPIYDESGNIQEYIAIRYLVTHYIDDEKTIKLIKEAFPDDDSVADKQVKKVKENKSTKKENKFKKDPNLIDTLKKEHKEIQEILEKIKESDKIGEKEIALLIKSKTIILNHLKKEDDKLYPVLKLIAKTDDSLKQTLKVFGKEMEGITGFVISFYDKYSDVEQFDKKSFYKDLSKFIVTFNDRVQKEEMILYKVYEKQ
jgi:PAS domain S-box-containing protein